MKNGRPESGGLERSGLPAFPKLRSSSFPSRTFTVPSELILGTLTHLAHPDALERPPTEEEAREGLLGKPGIPEPVVAVVPKPGPDLRVLPWSTQLPPHGHVL